jgi:hypothetical protein
MLCIAGIALLITFGTRDILSLFEQLTGLCSTVATYLGFGSPRRYGPPQFLMRSMVIYASTVLWYVIQVSERLILCLTPVFLLMRLTRPRPPIRVLLSQPGTIAGFAIVVGGVLVAGWLHFLFFGRLIDGTVKLTSAGGTVALAWAGMALCRQWRAEPSWIDRIGRSLGVAAILSALLALARYGF